MAVAIAGKIGSGKTTISSSLAKVLAWPRASFGDYVRKVVVERGVPQTRKNLQEIGTQLLQSDPRAFCSSVLSSCGWRAGENVIIDGMRHVETINIIRELVSPATLKIACVEVPEEIRLKRLRSRGEGTANAIAEVDAHSSEQQVEFILRSFADIVIQGDKDPDTIVAELTAWIGEQ